MIDCEISCKSLRCKRCGLRARNCNIRRNCKGRIGLGDRVAAILYALGITKKRVTQFSGKPCKCAERQAYLNEIGKRFGL